MHGFIRISYALVSSMFITFLSGCGGDSQIVVPASASAYAASVAREASARQALQTKNGFMQPVGAQTQLVYMSSSGTLDAVNVFTLSGLQIGQIINGLHVPSGLFVDSKSNLWVANINNQTITMYRRGGLSPSRTLMDPHYPVDVAVANDGTVYAADNHSGTVEVYASGSKTPTSTLTYPPAFSNLYITCDAAGNVFVTLITADSIGSGRIIEFPGGKQAGVKDLGITLQAPGGIRIDNAGNLLVADSYARTISEYTEAGVPTGKSFNPGAYIQGIAVGANDQLVIGTDANPTVGISWLFPSGKQQTIFGCCSRIGPPLQTDYDVAIDFGQKAI